MKVMNGVVKQRRGYILWNRGVLSADASCNGLVFIKLATKNSLQAGSKNEVSWRDIISVQQDGQDVILLIRKYSFDILKLPVKKSEMKFRVESSEEAAKWVMNINEIIKQYQSKTSVENPADIDDEPLSEYVSQNGEEIQLLSLKSFLSRSSRMDSCFSDFNGMEDELEEEAKDEE